MSESSNISKEKNSSAKKTFAGLLIFTIICVSVTCACIYMTLETKKEAKEKNELQNTLQDEVVVSKKNNHETTKLTDKAKLNGIVEEREKEVYGDAIDYFEYNNEYVYKLEVNYIQISGLKDRNVQATINQAIKDKVDELKEKLMPEIDNKDVERISISAILYGNFSDVISVSIEEFIHYDYNDENYENDEYNENSYGLNFSLETGELIAFKDLFWEDSPIKTILSQSIYKDFAWDYAFEQDEYEWDWNMDNTDYSIIESKVYNFMYKYNKNPNLDFWFTTSSIVIPYEKSNTISIDMADFYKYIAIYKKYKSNKNLYEENTNQKEFYVFANYVPTGDETREEGKKADNVYYYLECYDSLENFSSEGEKAHQEAYRTAISKINEYAKELRNNGEYGYIINGYYNSFDESEYDGRCGYNFALEIAECTREYFDKHLEDALAAGAREVKVDITPTNYFYIDKDNFEFYESYNEWVDNYTDESTKQQNTYTREDRQRDELEREKTEEEVENSEN